MSNMVSAISREEKGWVSSPVCLETNEDQIPGNERQAEISPDGLRWRVEARV